ncbi:hypothetical protein [Thiothrix nivea]|uniref:Uncharacterized protein n=1 Tax=Thiothrix nivea (strain ATCC 35100 / DSM 5205 / JP2) TaxID=870187 RepID=A0A656HFD3_THINJ|nr:hypothetical protein [Thiothrix nivea]EIJ35073.1 hypothetical protein Thini_2530 [Thiothrix nivea DSM 5205]
MPISSVFNTTHYRLALVTASLLLSQAAMAGDPVVFSLKNGAATPLYELYMSPPQIDDWEENVITVEVLQPNETITITVDDGREDCLYDIKAVFEDGDEVEHDSVHICDGESYVVY